jgi:hypothetical protein
LNEALPIAQRSNHRMHGPILTALADLHCKAGETQTGLDLAQRAVATNQESAATAPWYAAQAAITQSYCQALTGARVDGTASASMDELEKKWGSDSPFVRRAREQIAASSNAKP